MKRAITILFILCLNSFAQLKSVSSVHLKAGENFALLEIEVNAPNVELTKNSTNSTIVLYDVSIPHGDSTRILGLISTKNKELDTSKLKWRFSSAENRYLVQQLDKTTQATKILKNSPDYDHLQKEWKKAFQKQLEKKAKLYEDTELEYLLSLKLFHKPLNNTSSDWKKDDILTFLYRISGLQDIENAIPLKRNFTLNDHKYTEAPPANLLLPKVQVTPPIGFNKEKYTLSRLVPRSCYYMEFTDAKAMLTALDFVSQQFNQWSGNTYPQTLRAVIENSLEKSGLSLKKLVENSKKYGRLALAGWDPYYQSGTSLLVIVEKNGPQVKGHSFSKDGISAYSNSPKLISMAKSAFDKKRSLFHDSSYMYSREKLTSNKNEKFFIYLSDYWLTNFLSPRWQILSARLTECDARIRLTEILRLATKAENNLAKLPSVKDMQNIYKDHKELTWIMRDLSLKGDRVIHNDLGGLYNHSAIDQISFKKVSKYEKKTYESFKRAYSRNWREMDPLALQINKESDHWFSRLYVSPISRISDFRELRDIVLPNKETHLLSSIPTSAFGLSLKFQTNLIGPLIGGIKIPQKLQVSLRGLDMAPHVESLKYIHKERRDQDWWSYTRMPIMIEAPTLVVNNLIPLARASEGGSEYEGLTSVAGFTNDWLYNIFLHKGKDGYSRGAANPMALIQMTKNIGESVKTSHPSDIYFYLDLVKGYMMHRYLTLELTKNRIFANWRRHNRMERINLAFGEHLSSSVFPQTSEFYNVSAIPSPENENRYGSSNFSSQARAIPEIIKNLKKLELFISVDPNALLFETKTYIKETPVRPTTPTVRRGNRQEPQTTEPQPVEPLDFDE